MVDNFYDNPDEVRDYALSCEYYQPYPGSDETPGWNGRNYSEPWLATIDEHRYITEENVYKLEKIVNAKIDMDHFISNDWENEKGTRWNAGFHIKNKPKSSATDKGIHSHYYDDWNAAPGGYAAVVFLTPNHLSYVNNGVDFWKSNIGLDYLNVEQIRGKSHIMDYVNTPTVIENQPQPTWSLNGEWQMKARFSYNYNTMVINPSEEYHASSPGWGTTMEDGRMIQTFFFKTL